MTPEEIRERRLKRKRQLERRKYANDPERQRKWQREYEREYRRRKLATDPAWAERERERRRKNEHRRAEARNCKTKDDPVWTALQDAVFSLLHAPIDDALRDQLMGPIKAHMMSLKLPPTG